MSTAYRIRSPKRYITTNRLWEWFQEGKIMLFYETRDLLYSIHKKSQIKESVAISLAEGNYIWFYLTGKRVWHIFYRYGHNDPSKIIDFVEDFTGGEVISEHDEGFWS